MTGFPDRSDVGCKIKQAKMSPFEICQVWVLERLVYSPKKEVMAGHVHFRVFGVTLILNSTKDKKLEEIVWIMSEALTAEGWGVRRVRVRRNQRGRGGGGRY